MAECVECGSYTKYKGGLCPKCYKESKAHEEEEEEFEDEVTGLSEGKKKYTESIIKGRIAETLIQELFLNLGYSVFRYGMENTIPGIMTLLKGVKSETAKQIRRMPDFVIQHTKTGEVFFIEVKFRANEEFSRKNLPKDYPYENAYIILVSKKHIKCISVQELDEGEEITPESKNYLGNRKEFDLDKDTIVDFCQFAVKFFDFV
ncbi:MAG: hypothetical protein KA146_09190 [Leptospiraceae bacterium]|nr:hypothetical protein [Leptospiraceae bacterium]